MNFLQNLAPLNHLEEKAKFFADPTYNPQFLYGEPIDTAKLYQYQKPKPKYVALAREVIERTYYGRNEQELQMLEGISLDQDEVNQKVSDFLAMHGLAKRYQIVWSHSFVSRTTISSDTIKLRLPVDFRREGLIGMLYHEIGTHALRRINYEKQPWFKKKKQYGFSNYLKTEEGLASLHSLIPKKFQSAYVQALRYVAVDIAQSASFAELWHQLKKYIQDPERLWTVCIREKRGVTDTSKPGGYTKDLVYFEGMVDVWHWLQKHDSKIDDLYLGKLAQEDAEQARELNPNFKPLLPSFYSLNTDKYARNIFEIGKFNQFDQSM